MKHAAGALRELLLRGAGELGCAPSATQAAKLLRYVALLEQWNATYNLTGARSARTIVENHVLDCLTLLPFVTGERALDVGTGAGLPGLVLAVMDGDVHWTLLDSNHKKTRFLTQAVRLLELPNVDVVCRRVEDYRQSGLDTITFRAVGDLALLLAKVRHLAAGQLRLLAMKGKYPALELAAISEHYPVLVDTVTVPILEQRRHIVQVLLRGGRPG